MRTHELKILPAYFVDIQTGRKTAEIRYDDRDYRIGDRLILKEWKKRKKEFTGRAILVDVVGMTRLAQVSHAFASDELWNWCVLYFKRVTI